MGVTRRRPGLGRGWDVHLSTFNYVLWLASAGLEAGVLTALLKRRFHRWLPFFTAFILAQFVSTLYLFVLWRISYSAYYYAYWGTAALLLALNFAVVRELFGKAYSYSVPGSIYSQVMFRWALWGLSAIAVAVLLTAVFEGILHDLSRALLLADRVGRSMLLALVALLLMMRRMVGISKRSMLFGIAVGFVVFTPVRIAVDAGLPSGRAIATVLSRANDLAYIAACLIWLVYSLRAPDTREVGRLRSSSADPDNEDSRSELRRIEDVVDRVMRHRKKKRS